MVKEAPQADYIEMDLHLARINGQPRTSWIVEPADGRLPFQRRTKKAQPAPRRPKQPEDFANPENPRHPGALPDRHRLARGAADDEHHFNGNYQIIQTKDYVAIQVEMNHDIRMIRMGDRTHQSAALQPWLGDSVGWWEGETLVVETTNLNLKGHVYSLGGGFPYSPQTKITERFTRTAKDQILYEFSVDDPLTFTKVWRAEMPMRAAKGPIYEYACHEGNYSLPNILAGARAEGPPRRPDRRRAAASSSPLGLRLGERR